MLWWQWLRCRDGYKYVDVKDRGRAPGFAAHGASCVGRRIQKKQMVWQLAGGVHGFPRTARYWVESRVEERKDSGCQLGARGAGPISAC